MCTHPPIQTYENDERKREAALLQKIKTSMRRRGLNPAILIDEERIKKNVWRETAIRKSKVRHFIRVSLFVAFWLGYATLLFFFLFSWL